MNYQSTRGGQKDITAAGAIKQGIARDGGLFVPESIPRLTPALLEELRGKDYCGRAESIMALYLTDFSPAEIAACVNGAYGGDAFDHPHKAPLTRLDHGLYVQELWHGPTGAFKDMALQMLPQLMSASVEHTGEHDHIVILVATSGDTGKAALEGFRDVPGTSIVVFYPAEGVSQVQQRQMITQRGKNVHVIAVEGNFDDAQNGVKRIFADGELRERLAKNGIRLSSANSINWGRLLPQIVYYVSAWLDLLNEGAIQEGDSINLAVPTGNFGNILAAWYARAMGLPVHKLICASNANNVLTEFLHTGHYDRKRPFTKTLSPSMDILISSNLERLLYELSSRDHVRVQGWMSDLQIKGEYQVEEDVRQRLGDLFVAGWADDFTTRQAVRDCWEEYGYLLDTHTAVAWHIYREYSVKSGDKHPAVIVSTASPYKFADSVAAALPGASLPGHDEFQCLYDLQAFSGCPIPAPL
ncbi:MAG: threonine synthase, partial [Syntrophomonadaceae bacterium]|nr:threonine synthase [Syntrophomonadaceae bacterium]